MYKLATFFSFTLTKTESFNNLSGLVYEEILDVEIPSSEYVNIHREGAEFSFRDKDWKIVTAGMDQGLSRTVHMSCRSFVREESNAAEVQG